MRKNDPMRRYYKFFFICEGVAAIGIVFRVIVSIAAGKPDYFWSGYLIFFALLLTFAVFAFKRKHQRTEERRQRALSGDPAFLAQPQPQPDAEAVPLPAKIGLHMSIKYMAELYGVFVILMAIVLIVVFIIGAQTKSGDVPSIVIPIIIGFVVAFLLITFLVTFLIMFIIRSFFEQEVMLDEQGITTKLYRQTSQIPWNEVHSFAMWGNAKRFSTIQFEVTSDHGVARWFQIGSPRKVATWMTMLKPNMPYDEYCSKMAAIQQVIVARSGKPLYDLRDEKIVWW